MNIGLTCPAGTVEQREREALGSWRRVERAAVRVVARVLGMLYCLCIAAGSTCDGQHVSGDRLDLWGSCPVTRELRAAPALPSWVFQTSWISVDTTVSFRALSS